MFFDFFSDFCSDLLRCSFLKKKAVSLFFSLFFLGCSFILRCFPDFLWFFGGQHKSNNFHLPTLRCMWRHSRTSGSPVDVVAGDAIGSINSFYHKGFGIPSSTLLPLPVQGTDAALVFLGCLPYSRSPAAAELGEKSGQQSQLKGTRYPALLNTSMLTQKTFENPIAYTFLTIC